MDMEEGLHDENAEFCFHKSTALASSFKKGSTHVMLSHRDENNEDIALIGLTGIPFSIALGLCILQ